MTHGRTNGADASISSRIRKLWGREEHEAVITRRPPPDMAPPGSDLLAHELQSELTTIRVPIHDPGAGGHTAPAETVSGEPPLPSPVVWDLGRTILNEYVLEKELGEGGMGRVYLARSRFTELAFAVKKAKFTSPKSRRQFLTEVRTWIDLPEHPHLAACRFFRTVDDEVIIFADYIGGGSLADWIRDLRLTGLGDILDAAIQFAWGLDALHRFGLVHQDVKPSNALVAPRTNTNPKGLGVLKVSDFGLARAAQLSWSQDSEEVSPAVTSAGKGTPLYCSPEQAAGKRLSPHSDVWSWGVSVLEMFAGEATWLSGVAARGALEAFLDGGHRAGRPAMPGCVAEVLYRCFEDDPAERWERLTDAAEALGQAHAEELGRPYSRQAPAATCPHPVGADLNERRTRFGEWDDPVVWLRTACEAVGSDFSMVGQHEPPRPGSLKAQAIEDLAIFEQARQLFEEAIAKGQRELRFTLASMCMEKSLAHAGAEDYSGAVESYQIAIAVFEQLVEHRGRWDLARYLAIACMNKGVTVRNLGDPRQALELHDRAIHILEELVENAGEGELAKSLANAYINRAAASKALGDLCGAKADAGRGVQLLERLVKREGRLGMANELARAYVNMALTVRALGDTPTAVTLYDRAIRIRKRLVEREGRRDLAHDLAIAYQNKSAAVQLLGDLHGAISLCERAIEVLEHLVEREGRQYLANDLARTYNSKATLLLKIGEYRGAAALYDQCIETRARLVEREGRRDLANDLAETCMSKAVVMQALGNLEAGIAFIGRAIRIREGLVEDEGRTDLAEELARTYITQALALQAAGNLREAAAFHGRGVEILEPLVEGEGRPDLAGYLANACQNRAIVIRDLGDPHAAVELLDRAIRIREQLSEHDGHGAPSAELASAWVNKAFALQHLEDHSGAIELYNSAIQVLGPLVEDKGNQDVVNDLATACINMAASVESEGNLSDAIALIDCAIDVLEKSLQHGGQDALECEPDQQESRAGAKEDDGLQEQQREAGDPCRRHFEPDVKHGQHRNREQVVDLGRQLAEACFNKGETLAALGDTQGAMAGYDRAIEVLQQLVEDEGGEFADNLCHVKSRRAAALAELADQRGFSEPTARPNRGLLGKVLRWTTRSLGIGSPERHRMKD